MSLFVHSENQNLLWNIIKKTDHFVKVFYNGSQYDSNEWFKIIIAKFFDENKYRNLDNNELLNLNRIVLTFMIESLKHLSDKNDELLNNKKNHFELLNPFLEPPNKHFVETKEEIFNRQLAERQQNFDTMYNKPPPPKVDFGDKIKDDVIHNMDILLNQQIKQREDELKLVNHKPFIQINDNVNISNSIEEINDDKKKTVSWSDNIDGSQIDDLKIQINDINNKIDKIYDFLQDIHNNK